jgi:hypothetical protein
MATPSDNDESNNLGDYQNQFHLAKLLLVKYGVLHSFHELQLGKYPIACCNISIDGSAEVDADTKTVTYNMYTKKAFFKEGSTTKERHKWSIARFLNVSAELYNKEKDLAFKNLQSWSRHLLWPDTKVVLYVDGSKYKESSFN